MAFCPNCGANVEGRFCPKCGTAVSAAGPSAASTGMGAGAAPASGYAPPGPVATTGGLTDNVAGALCYLLTVITGILFLVIAPYNQNRFVRFHAFQAIFMGIAVIVLQIAISIVSLILAKIIGVLGMLFSLVSLVISLGFFVLWIYMMYSAYQGKTVVLPVIGPLAQQQANTR